MQIGKETDYGTPVSTDKDVGVVSSFTPGRSRSVISVKRFNELEPHAFLDGDRQGSMNFNMQYQHGRIFDYVLGTAVHTTDSTDRIHTWDGLKKKIPSFTAVVSDIITPITYRWTGLRVSNLTIDVALNSSVKNKVQATGKWPTAFSQTPRETTTDLPVFTDNDANLFINNVKTSMIQSANVTFAVSNANIKEIGSQDVVRMPTQSFQTTFKFQVGFTTNYYHTLFDDNETTTLRLEVLNDKALGSGRRGFILNLDNCKFTTFTEQINTGSNVFLDIAGNANFQKLQCFDNINSSDW